MSNQPKGADTLPPLPEPLYVEPYGASSRAVYSQAQMYAYALQARGGSTGTSEPGRVTVAGLAMASGRKMLGIMRAIETAGEGSVTANQSLTTDQILQAAAYLAAPEGAGTSEPAGDLMAAMFRDGAGS